MTNILCDKINQPLSVWDTYEQVAQQSYHMGH